MPHEQFSSFQIAKMLHVSRQAVNQWIDKGYIQSYRTPGGHRRVSRADLVQFLNARSIPLPPELDGDPGRVEDSPLDIVMIDDDQDFMDLLHQALQEVLPQARVRKYANGMDGLLGIGNELPHLLLLDMRMPEMDGHEVIRRLKANELTATLPIIVITAYDEGPALEAMRKLKIEMVLTKDTPLLTLTQEILTFLTRPQKIVG